MKRAVIIGCGNVGFATIERLALDNWCIYVFDLKEPDYLHQYIGEHKNIYFRQMNARDTESVRTAFSGLSDSGKIDFVLCSVGVNNHETPMSDFAKFADVIDINVMGNIIPIKELVNQSMIKEGGKIVVLGSTSGHFAGIALDPYAVSKWILVNICESLQHELVHSKISLEIVNPRSIQNVRSNVFESKSGVTVKDVVNQIFRGGARSFVPKYYGLFHPIERSFPWIFDFAFGLKPSFIRKRAYQTSYQNIIITGASSGLGKALVEQYTKSSKKIFCIARNLEKLERLKTEIEQNSTCQIIPVSADLSDIKSVDVILKSIGEENIDLVINNAGQHIAGSILDCDIDVFRRSLNVNCLSHIYLTSQLLQRPVVPLCVVDILSTTAVSGRTNLGIYSSPKAGLWAWTKVFRRNYGKQIHIVEVVPATFESSLSNNELNYANNDTKGHSLVSSSKENLTSEKVAKIIATGLKHRKDKIYVPQAKVSMFIDLEAFCPSLFRKLFS